MKQSASNRKVNEQAREVIASILLFDVSDPRLHLVTITGCEVSYDRSACNVYYTTDPERYADVQAAFEQAAGHIRSLMAKKLSWRVAPELRFHRDKRLLCLLLRHCDFLVLDRIVNRAVHRRAEPVNGACRHPGPDQKTDETVTFKQMRQSRP